MPFLAFSSAVIPLALLALSNIEGSAVEGSLLKGKTFARIERAGPRGAPRCSPAALE